MAPWRNSSSNDLFSLRTFLIYGVTFSLGFYVASLLFPFIKFPNVVLVYLFYGLCLELSAKICQLFMYRKSSMSLDIRFIKWVLTHSVIVFVVLLVVNKLALTNKIIFFLAVGFGIAIFTHIIWRFLYRASPKKHSFGKFKLRHKLVLCLLVLNIITPFIFPQYILNILGLDVVFIVAYIWGWTRACPRCKSHWAKTLVDKDYLGGHIGFERGNDILGWKPISKTTIQNYWVCKYCHHAWKGRVHDV